MIVDGEKRHYTTIKSISRLLSKLNGKTRRAYHFCMNCLNGFRKASARDKHYEYCSGNDYVKVNMPTGKKNGQKVKRYRDRMKTMNTERKGKASYTENINTHVPSGWCVNSTFAYGDASDPLKMYQSKDCVEKL